MVIAPRLCQASAFSVNPEAGPLGAPHVYQRLRLIAKQICVFFTR